MIKLITDVINTIRTNKGLEPIVSVKPGDSLRADFGFDSLDLAELTVRIEKETGIDVFADGIVNTVGEIMEKINK